MSKKNLKKALIPSLIALALCFAMLLGTTFAWFTDSAEVSANVIKSGNLDLELQIGTVANGEVTYADVTADTKVLPADALWEPGYAACINAQVVNKGNLAFKYTLKVINAPEAPATGSDAVDLAAVIDVWYAAEEVVVDDRDYAAAGLTKIGTLRDVINQGDAVVMNDFLLAKAETDTDYPAAQATIVLVMQETAGNAYQGLDLGEAFSIQIVATQYTYESDAFDNSYDAAAEFPTD